MQNPKIIPENGTHTFIAAIRTPEELIRCYEILDTTKDLYPEDEMHSILGALSIIGQTFASQTVQINHVAEVIPLHRDRSRAS